MTRDTVYCDDCGVCLTPETERSVTELPFAVASANVGESAVLCTGCLAAGARRIGVTVEEVLAWHTRHGTAA